MRRIACAGILGVVIALLSGSAASAQLLHVVNGANQTSHENFNSLASSGTSNVIPNGAPFAFSEAGAGGTLTYAADNGSNATGNTYSYGATGNSERALGELTTSTVQSTFGYGIVNNTGATIPTVLISYTGEEWRLGATGTVDQLDFQWAVNPPSLITGTYVDANQLDFASPNNAVPGALDGNVPPNRTDFDFVPIQANIPDNGTFYIRWVPFLVPGSNTNDGLAVDDLTIQTLQDDADGDGVTDSIDNCATQFNGNQANNDGDGQGDACDFDDDNDGDTDLADNCDFVANADQANIDNDNEGDACDTDDDGDGLLDTNDDCPTVSGPPSSNGCPPTTPPPPDFDSDGVPDASDNCITEVNADQADLDADGEGDECDADDDGDAVVDTSDQCPQVAGAIENRGCAASALPPPDTSACDAAKAKLAKAKAKLKKLRANDASKDAIDKAKQKVKKAKAAVKTACAT